MAKDKNNNRYIQRHVKIPMELMLDIKEENVNENRGKDETISTEKTILSLIEDGLKFRKLNK